MNISNGDIVADLYDSYVPTTYDIDFFINEAQKAPGDVLELRSGNGWVSIPLFEVGVKLTCVDISAQLNEVFRKQLQQKELIAEVYILVSIAAILVILALAFFSRKNKTASPIRPLTSLALGCILAGILFENVNQFFSYAMLGLGVLAAFIDLIRHRNV